MSKRLQNQVTLKRALGFWQSFGIAVGLVVAATTIVSLCNYFGNVGPAFILPAAVSGLVCIFIVMSYAELSTAIPGAGMVVDFTMPAMGRSMAIFAMLSGYIVLISAAGACETFIAGLCAEELSGFPYKWFAALLLAVFLVVNLLGVEFLGRSQIILTSVKMMTLAALGIGGLLQIGTISPQIPVDFMPYGWGPVLTSMAGGIWLYIGIEYVCPMSEEIINPEKNIPRAMITGIIAIFVADMLFGEAIVRYVPLELLSSAAVPQMLGAQTMFGTFGFVMLAVATVFSGASAANSHMASVPRMIYGLARDGMLPGFLAYLHPKFRTPWAAIFAALGCLSIPFLINLDIDAIMGLISIACVAWLVSYSIVQVDHIILRIKYPKMHRSFKSPFFPVPQIIGISVCLYAIVTTDPEAIKNASIFMVIFFAYSLIWVKFKMKKKCFEQVPFQEMPHVTVKFDE